LQAGRTTLLRFSSSGDATLSIAILPARTVKPLTTLRRRILSDDAGDVSAASRLSFTVLKRSGP
jgi:hypothetical protein